jgi:hypothetical protein
MNTDYQIGWNAAMQLVAESAILWSLEKKIEMQRSANDDLTRAALDGAKTEMDTFAVYVRDVLKARCPVYSV